MENGYVPIQVKSGVRKGSEEGIEVTVKHTISVQRKGPFHYTRGLREDLNFFWIIAAIILFVSWYGLGYVVYVLFGSAMSIIFVVIYVISAFILFFFLPIFLHLTRDKVWIWVEEEKQETIFFRRVSIANVNDVREVHSDWEKVCYAPKIRMDYPCDELYTHRDPAVSYDLLSDVYKDSWKHSEWSNIFGLGDEGEIWVLGYDVDSGGSRYAKIYCPDLYDRVWHASGELINQIVPKLRKQKLEYLEIVGRYEEAARIYEDLDMPEKAGEMRRKKREIVALDLNALIRQLGERGFTITYCCSHCGAPVSINGETKTEAIQYCSHCGSRIETIDVASFIKKYLS